MSRSIHVQRAKSRTDGLYFQMERQFVSQLLSAFSTKEWCFFTKLRVLLVSGGRVRMRLNYVRYFRKNGRVLYASCCSVSELER